MPTFQRFPRLTRIALVVFALCLLFVAACSGDDSDSRPDDDQQGANTTSIAPVTTETPRLEQRAADVALPVSFTTGDVVFEITKVEFANATPGTYLETDPDLIDDELLYVTFVAQVDPAISAPDAARDWPAMNFKIVTGDGRVIAASGVDFTEFVELAPEGPTTAAVVFPAHDEDLVGASFRLDDGVNPPAEVVLAAPTTTTAAPG